jgi:hypothetical protein
MNDQPAKTLTLPNEWDPRSYQLPAWCYLQNGGKRAVLVWHRRAGKDSMTLNWTAVSAAQRVGLYWHMAPTQRQVRKIVWDGIASSGVRFIEQAFPADLRAKTNDQEMKIELINGSIWQCVGSDNYDNLVGANPVGVVFSEYALADPTAWSYVRPILAENGGWAVFIYTPRGRNHGVDIYNMARREPDWFAQLLTVEDTRAIPSHIVERERREMADEFGNVEDAGIYIRQEYYCSFDAIIRGSYYGAQFAQMEKNGQLTRVPYDAGHAVTTAWDLGIGDDTAIWFVQQVGREVRVIDYYANRGYGLDHYAKVLKSKPYAYDNHILPHDAEASELITGTTRVKALAGLGIRGTVLPMYKVDDGINAVRALLNRCVFDAEKCKDGISALRQYQRKWDERLRVFADHPLHDFCSHAADAFRYLAHGLKTPSIGRTQRPQVAEGYSIFG